MTMTFRGKIDTSCDIEYKLQYRNIAISYDTDLNIGIFQLLLYRFQHRSIVTSKFPTAKKSGNQEKLATLGTQDTERRQTKQIT